MMRRIAFGLLMAFTLIVFARDSDAFDTNTVKGPKGEHWHSIYVQQDFIPRAYGEISPQQGARNEHADLTELTLQQMGIDGVIGKSSGKTLTVVDLNASLFRPFLGREDTFPGSNANRHNPLEQRLLPTVSMWSGVPDFGYSIDDWINKHYFCPPRHGDGFGNCHVYFGGWLSAFNSGHFGQQGADTYALFHRAALNLARDAANLRKLVDGSSSSPGFPGDRDAHRDKIEEAEMMAYYYESVAQHFLQDRWSTGHMWERWNAPDVDQNPYGDNVILASEVGAASGLLHGSEALFGMPDAVSSPYYSRTGSFLGNALGLGSTAIYPVTFRLGDTGPILHGMGDERLQDWFDGGFGREYVSRGYADVPVNISRQRGMMMECLTASWAEVIRAVGHDPQSGGYGVIGIRLGAPFNRDYRPNHTCTDMWLTNEAVAMGWLGDNAALFGSILRSFVSGAMDLAGAGNPVIGEAVSSLGLRTDWGAVTAKIMMRYWRDPNGTDLAHGGLPPLGLAQQGGAYGPPNYARFTDLNTLPDRDDRTGTDKQAVFGFFNRAKADYFCRGLAERLKDLRGSKDSTKRAACHYLADRAWAGTDPSYDGVQKEERLSSDGQKAHAICQLFQGDARIATGRYDEDVPEYLHPGYTPIKMKSDKGRYGQDQFKVTSASVGNWCDKIPVLHYVGDKEKRDQDVVVVQEDLEDDIRLRGMQLGDNRGRLRITTADGRSGPEIEIARWSDDEIHFKFKDNADPGESDFLVQVIRADNVQSVGRFVVRLEPRRPEIAEVTIRQKGKTLYHDKGDPLKADRYQLIDEGDAEIEIVFKEDMATKPVDGKSEQIRIGVLDAKGEWSGSTTWKGRVAVPGGDNFGYNRGVWPLSVLAASEKGIWIDEKADEPGFQPDTARRLVIDRFPVFAKELAAGSASGGTFYRASWSGIDPAARDSILEADLKGVLRDFSVKTAKALPAEGKAQVRLTLSAAVTVPPRVQVGSFAIAMTGKDDKWSGSFDVAAVLPKDRDDLIPVTIGVSDAFGRNLDSDPRTLTAVALPAPEMTGRAANWWKHYEKKPGEESIGTGGDDRWHKFGPPPLASLVVLLDGSGSMEQDNKMANAKQGLVSALDRLPQGFEIGAVTFAGCGSVRSFGFTKSKQQVKDNILGISPSGGTPLAAGVAASRVMLETEAHPLSKQWSFLPFSDGMENCNGNVGSEMGMLNASIRKHNDLSALAEEEKEKPSDDPVERLPEVACQPAMRTAYDTEVRSGGLHLDTIYLIETVFQEKKDVRGNCTLTLTKRRFGVSYAESRGKIVWRVNSKPSKSTTDSEDSRDGWEAVSAFRERALAGFAELRSMAEARGTIDSAVRRSVGG